MQHFPEPLNQKYLTLYMNNDIFRYFWRSFIKIWMQSFKYTWEDTCRAFNFERAILYNGSAMVFKSAETREWYSLPYIAEEGISKIYGEPVKPVGVGVLDAYIKPYKDEYVIVYDNITREPPINAIYTAAYNCYDIYITYRYNLKHQRKPYIIAGKRNDQLTINNMINDIDNNEIYLKVSSKFDVEETFKVLDLKIPYIGGNLLADLNIVQNWFLEEIGCITGVAKRERMNENEVFADERKARINLAGRLQARRDALEDLASRTDFNGIVEVNDIDPLDLGFTEQDVNNVDNIAKEEGE